MNEIVFLLCQKPSTALKYLLIYNVFTRAAEGTEAGDGGGGGVNVGHSLSPPSHFMLATGLGPSSFGSFHDPAKLFSWLQV